MGRRLPVVWVHLGAEHLHGLDQSEARAFLYLWGANTSTTTITGPNTGLVEVKGNTVATSGRLWAFASYSRFIRPGAVRIGTTTTDAGLEASAFRNSDGSIAVVVLNSAHSREVATFSLRGLDGAHVRPYLTDTSHKLSAQASITVRNSRFTATVPSRSLVSYDILIVSFARRCANAPARTQTARPQVAPRCAQLHCARNGGVGPIDANVLQLRYAAVDPFIQAR